MEKIFTISVNEDAEERKLTKILFEKTILEIGNEEDKWYSRKFDYYKDIEKIEIFRIGEFYEILDLVNYCRRKKYLHIHKDKWNSLLKFYINNNEIDSIFRRNAIYETIFLNLNFYEVDYEKLKDRTPPEGNLKGFEQNINFYLENFKNFSNADELQEAQNILNIIFTSILDEKIDISESQLKIWVLNLYKEINFRLKDLKNWDEHCKFLEQKGNFLFMINKLRNNKDKCQFIDYYYKVLENLDKAQIYPVSQFGERINKYIKIQINIDPKDDGGVIAVLEKFSEELFPYVEKREGKIQLAKQQVQRGIQYLNKKESTLMLRALEYFHKAKMNYQNEDTLEGFVRALLNIAQIYISLGMNYAGKYYILGAFRVSTNNKLSKKVEDSLALLFNTEYRQGSWFGAISIYELYINYRDTFNIDKSDYKIEHKVTHQLSFLLYTMRKISNQFNYFIDDYIKYLDYIGSDIILPIFKRFDEDFNTKEKFNKYLLYQLDDQPLNDVGKFREISFYALGSLWKFKFKNDYSNIYTAEEFISNCQILFAEIALFGYDFHLIKTEVEIELEIADKLTIPIQLPSNEIIKRKVYVYEFDIADVNEANKHTALNTMAISYVLNSISLLEHGTFKEQFFKLIQDRNIDNKQLSINVYQRIYRDIFFEEDLQNYQQSNYQKVDLGLPFAKENHFMKWNDSISNLYNQKQSLEAIKSRYENAEKAMHITLRNLKLEGKFKGLIHNLRDEGWKDWQIISNILNFILDYKIRLFESETLGKTTSNDLQKVFHTMFWKYMKIDEKDNYISFPIDAFESEEFNMQFKVGLIAVLHRYNLECKFQTPPFNAVREFLNVKFNYDKDEYNDINPLKDV